jgi:hypothetical protein
MDVPYQVQGRGEGHTGFRWKHLRETYHLEDPCIDERIILRLIFRKWDVRVLTRSIWFGQGHVAGTC